MTDPAKNDVARATTRPDMLGNKRGVGHGAPLGNDNGRGNLRHGLKAGKLPARLQYIEHRINSFRRHLENEVMTAKGEVGIVDAAAINSACKWERHGLLAQHWLRHEADSLSAGDRLKFSEAIAKASDNRDKNLRTLGLDAKPDMWAVIDAPANGNPNGKTEATEG